MQGTSEAVAIPPPAMPPAGARRRRWLEEVLSTSFGRALALFVAAVPLMYVAERATRESSIFVAFLALCGFSVADPLLILRRRSWWAGAGPPRPRCTS